MEFGLVGARLGHSFSKQIHESLGYAYKLLEVDEAAFDALMESRAFKGINITIPYKRRALAFCHELDDKAAAIGAVNTVVNRGGRLFGYNTDFDGLAWQLARQGVALEGRVVLLLGNGGTAATARAVATGAGAGQVLTASRRAGPGCLGYTEAAARRDVQILVNTSPVGMFPNLEGLPLAPSLFPRLEALVDVVYNPLATRLVLEARKLGVPAFNGLPMLVAQAVRAGAHFTGKPFREEDIPAIHTRLADGLVNLALIGMPGSGKTTLGRRAAALLGRPFADSDALVEERAGCGIPEIFAAEGEEAFRQMETRALRELAGRTGQVIACGGGVVTRPENLELLRHNSLLVFLHCPAEELVLSGGRPLAKSREELRALERLRLPLYRAAADAQLERQPDAEKGARALAAAFEALVAERFAL